MKSRQIIGGIVAGSLVAATVGYMRSRPRNKAMSMMRKGMKMIKF